jgi:hypothetical protein
MSPYYWLLDTANGAHDTVANFKDGIKRDASLYPILRTALLSIAEILVVSLEKTRVIFKDTLPRYFNGRRGPRPYGCRPYSRRR